MEKKSLGTKTKQTKIKLNTLSNPASTLNTTLWKFCYCQLWIPACAGILHLIDTKSCFVCLSSGITPKSVTKGRETVVLSCDYNTTTEELASLRIYWQKDSKMVLAILLEKCRCGLDHENRTITDISNLVWSWLCATRQWHLHLCYSEAWFERDL